MSRSQAMCASYSPGATVSAAAGRSSPLLSLKSLWRSFWAHRAEQASIVLLKSLDDRTLSDIGFNRSEIESVVRNRSSERLHRYEPNWE